MTRIARAPFVSLALMMSLLTPTAIADASTPLMYASVAYARFSPDRDGYRDLLPITYKTTATSRNTVRIYRGTTLVRTLKAASYQVAGTYRLRWNGVTGTGAAAPAGTYRWVVEARRGTTSTRVGGYVSLTRLALPRDRWLGFFVQGAPQDTAPLSALQSITAVDPAVTNYFQNTTEGFTSQAASNAVAAGTVPLITLEFWDPAKGVNQPGYSLKSISSGAWDDYLHRYARDAKAFGRTVWLRPLHEMNGNWYPWAGTVNGNTPADFVPAWRHMHDIFAAEGATNVKFVWCPNSDSVPNTYANAFARYWPGDAYVDYIALDGYNFGTSQSWSSWRSFADTFGNAYTQVTALSPKPMFIAETGCSTSGGDKAAWIASMFSVIPQRFPRLQGVCWFNVNKECDWRVESSAGSLSSFSTYACTF